MSKEGFFVYENYRNIAKNLPDDLRVKFYDALMDYALDGIEPSDPIVSALITAIKPSLNKVENRGGCHNPTGQNQHTKGQKEVKSGQSCSKEVKDSSKDGQSGQSFIKQETRNKKQEDNLNISFGKPQDIFVKNNDFDITKINEVLKKHNLAEIKKLTDERKTKLKQRCNDVGGFDEFLREMDLALVESSFLRGDSNRGWKADFDFFLQKSSWQKAIEGGYRDNKPPEQSQEHKQKESEERLKKIYEMLGNDDEEN